MTRRLRYGGFCTASGLTLSPRLRVVGTPRRAQRFWPTATMTPQPSKLGPGNHSPASRRETRFDDTRRLPHAEPVLDVRRVIQGDAVRVDHARHEVCRVL